MKKQFFILNSESGNVGVAKYIPKANKSSLVLQFNNPFSEKYKCFVESENNAVELGSLNKKTEIFSIENTIIPEKIYIKKDETSEPIIWSGEKKQKILSVTDKAPPEEFTFENFFGGGFDWRRIRGNFIIFDYSIIHYILSAKNVYPAINRAGYYWAGIRKDEDITIIAIAIPILKGMENPFSSLSADVYKIKSGKLSFNTICTGIDKTGEFFLSL